MTEDPNPYPSESTFWTVIALLATAGIPLAIFGATLLSILYRNGGY